MNDSPTAPLLDALQRSAEARPGACTSPEDYHPLDSIILELLQLQALLSLMETAGHALEAGLVNTSAVDLRRSARYVRAQVAAVAENLEMIRLTSSAPLGTCEPG